MLPRRAGRHRSIQDSSPVVMFGERGLLMEGYEVVEVACLP
jgi:hypothetical protein